RLLERLERDGEAELALVGDLAPAPVTLEAGSSIQRRIVPDRPGRRHGSEKTQHVEELVTGAAVRGAVDEVAETGTPPPVLERPDGRTHAVLAVPVELPHEVRPAQMSGTPHEVAVDPEIISSAQTGPGLARAEDLRAPPQCVAAAERPADRDVRIGVDPHLEGFAKESHHRPLLRLEAH